MKISDLSIRRPIYVIVLFLVIALLGLIGYSSLQSELMPKFTPPSLSVQVIYPGASPAEVENSLSRKLEDCLSSLQGVESVRSYSFEGMSMVLISFTYGTDIDKAMTDAQNKIDSKKVELPSGILAPMVNKITVDEKSIITLSATAGLEPMELSDFVHDRILPELLRIPGMAKVLTVGDRSKEIQVNLNMEKMRSLGLAPVQVLGALRAANLDFPTGSIKDAKSNTAVRLSGKLEDIETIRSLALMTLPTGTQIRLSDIAEVLEMPEDVSKIARINGQDAVLLNIFKQGDANAIELSDNVRTAIAKLEGEYQAEALKLDIVSDTSDFTRASIRSVLMDLLLAVILVAVVILLFLGNIRNALIVMLVIPLSLIGSFIGMKLFGFTLNMMSLLGLSVVIGVLVDDAIVVIENVYRHMEMGKSALKASSDAMKEIGTTVITVTVVLIIVFLPIALTNSLVSDILRQFCGVIIFSIFFSLVSALTLVPLLTSRFGKLGAVDANTPAGKFLAWFERQVEAFRDWVLRILARALGHKRWVGLAVIVLAVLICALFPLKFIGFEFMPDVDQSEFNVVMEMPKDISIEESSKMVAKAERWLLDKPEVQTLVTKVGFTGGSNAQDAPYLAEISVKLLPPSERELSTVQYTARLQKPLEDYLVDAQVRLFPAALHGAGNSSDIEYVIYGSNADSVAAFADFALKTMSKIPGTLQQQLSSGSGMPEVEVVVDRDKMSALGLSLDNVGLTLQLAFQGNNTMKYVKDNHEYDINIRADKDFRKTVEDVSSLSFMNSQGSMVSLDQFAEVRLGTGPNKLERYNRNPSVTIRANVNGISPGQASGEFLEKVKDRAAQSGCTIETAGDMKSMKNSMGVMGGALLLSIILMYLAMVLLYNNWTDPLVVMFSIPFSILGAILALALSGTSMSIYAMLGLVMLVGLVAKNAILLVDFANERLSEGASMDEALLDSVKMRTRPILMTALSTIIGMIPVAVASGSGAELRNGLGWVIIGGMALSTFLTLIVVPVVYKIMHKKARG